MRQQTNPLGERKEENEQQHNEQDALVGGYTPPRGAAPRRLHIRVSVRRGGPSQGRER